MNRERLTSQIGYLLLGILLLLFFYLLTSLFPFYTSLFRTLLKVISPFIIAIFLAYLLHPIVDKLHDFHVPRWLAIIIIYLFVLLAVGVLGYFAYPALLQQGKELQNQIPQLIQSYREAITQLYEATSFLPEMIHDRMDEFFIRIEARSGAIISESVNQITHLFDYIIILAVIPVLLFYFLKDTELIKQKLYTLIPTKHKENSKELVKGIDQSLGGYIRGQLIVCLFVFLTTYIVYLIVGMEYPLILALVMGVMNIIPYFGPIIGAIPAVVIALTISLQQMVYVLIGVIIVQLIESNLLSPYIVGKSIHTHPVLIVLALLIGSEVAGIVGMIFAVPLLAVLNVIIKQSRSYTSKD